MLASVPFPFSPFSGVTLDTQVKLGAPSSSPGDSMGAVRKGLGHPLPSFPVSFFPFPFSLLPFCLSGLGSVCFIPPFPPRFPFPLFCLLVGCFPACSLPLLCFPLFSCCCLSLAVHVPSFLPSPRLCVCVFKPPNFPRSYDLIHLI